MQHLPHENHVFEVRGVPKWSQNGSQNASKIKLRCGGPPGEPPGAPRGSPEAPESASGEQDRRPKMTPRRPKMSLRRDQSELREVPGGFRERFGLDFSKNATPSTRKPCFLRSGGSQNEAKMLQFRRCVRTPRCFEKCNTLAQWPAWGRSPTGDPATEPRRARAWPSRSVLVSIWTS